MATKKKASKRKVTQKRPARKVAKKSAVRKAPKKKPAKKAARPRRLSPAAVPANAPVVIPSAAPVPPKRNGLLLGLLVIGLLLAVLWRSQRESTMQTTTASPTIAAEAPEGRSAAPPVPAAQSPAVKPAEVRSTANQPRIRRESAGEIGDPSLTFDRSDGGKLSVRCWRPANGMAHLDVFGPRNQKIVSLQSEAGDAGWKSLSWDGKDAQGKKVPEGLYYIRPSASSEALQQIRDVWVKG